MPCLVCEKRIPLLLQLSGSRFCSEDHRQKHDALQASLAVARLAPPPPRQVPVPEMARFALRLPDVEVIESDPDMGGPIPQFQDLILCRRFLRTRYTMGLKGAKTITCIPGASPPAAAGAIAEGVMRTAAQVRLAPSRQGAPDVALRLPAAALAGLFAQNLRRAVDSNAAALQPLPWDPRLKPASRCASLSDLKRPSLRRAPPSAGNTYNRNYLGSFLQAKAPDAEWDLRTSWSGVAARLILRAESSLPAPAALQPLQDAFPLRLKTEGLTPKTVTPSPIARFSFRIASSPDALSPAKAGRIGSSALQDTGELFAPLDSVPARWSRLAPSSFPLSLAMFTPTAATPPANADDGYSRKIGAAAAGPNAIRAAGLMLEGLAAPAALPGFSGPLYVACDFPLCPVWLPALFDEVGGTQAALRRSGNPAPVLRTLSDCDDFLPADGPGFSGVLACPQALPACWEFRETRKSEEASKPMAVLEPPIPPEPSAPPEQSAPREPAPPSDSSWQRALHFWRQAPALARGMALVIPLMAPTLFYGPRLSLQAQSARPNSWTAAIKARATVDLQDDFHAGFSSWGGKPGWETTWSIDGSGSAQPGRLALYNPTIPLTDYRLEFQGQILSKALGMALRAADTNNYQAVKIGIVKSASGPLSSLTLARYLVIDGQEGPKKEVAIPLTVRSDTLYKLLVLVQGDHYSVSVNGLFADAWTESRLKSGGIGFFADKGEVARVRSVHVIDKQDFLGWLCYQVSQWTADRPPIGEKHE